MATADIPQSRDSTTGTVADALGLLTRDHRLVAELFREFVIAGKQQLDPLARRICKMLRIHAQIKEELFYPAVRRAFNDGGRDSAALLEATVREQELRQSIMLIESLTSDSPDFVAAVTSLADEVNAHFAREEQEIYPPLRQAKVDLVNLGFSLAERRDTLMDVLGLHADDEEAAVYPDENPAIAIATAERQERGRERTSRS